MPIGLVMLVNFTVNYLLLLGTARLCRQGPSIARTVLGAAVGAAHAGLCLVPGFSFLGGLFWRLVSMPLMGMAAFGVGRERLKAYGVLSLLCLALDGIVLGDSGQGMLMGACGICILCLLLAWGKRPGGTVPVLVQYGQNQLQLTALRDTGNGLRDPVSGASVMVIGAEAAKKLTGLTVQQLKNPLETLGAIPGLRLIPYKAVGSSGFLLAMKLPKVKIGSWQGSYVVAFAPEGLEKGSGYEALIGGTA